MMNGIRTSNNIIRRKGLRISRAQMTEFGCVLLLLPFFRVQLISIMMERNGGIWTTTNTLLNVLQAIITFIEVGLYLTKKKKNPKREHLLYGFLLFQITMLLASMLNGSFVFSTSLSNFMVIGFILLSYRFIRKDKFLYLNSIELITGVLSIIGAVTTIIMPLGFYPSEVNLLYGYGGAVYLLGSKNAAVFYFVTFLFVRFYKEIELKGKYSNLDFILFALFFGSTLSTDSINGTLALLIFFMYFILAKFNLPFKKFLKPRFLAVLAVAAAIIVLFGLTPDLSIFSNLGRDVSFTGRTTLWYLAVQGITKHPILGNGVEASVYISERVYGQVHSTYLDIAFKYGIPALIIFIIICLDMFRITSKIPDNRKKILIAVALFIQCIHNITDAPYYTCMIVIMCIAEKEAMNSFTEKGPHRNLTRRY